MKSKRWEASVELSNRVRNCDYATGEKLLQEVMEAEIPEFMELLASVDEKLDRVQFLAEEARDHREYLRANGCRENLLVTAAKLAAYEDVLRIFNRTPKG